ncbi:hypothetical protein CF326_g8065 [Tilletia indica]|nr:hypothetical protein CF326_g8065 [Tilletia indica]
MAKHKNHFHRHPTQPDTAISISAEEQREWRAWYNPNREDLKKNSNSDSCRARIESLISNSEPWPELEQRETAKEKDFEGWSDFAHAVYFGPAGAANIMAWILDEMKARLDRQAETFEPLTITERPHRDMRNRAHRL